jgi:hypothetical protein
VSTVELLVARCAGLDVAKDELVACVRVPDGRGGRCQEVRTFQTFTSGLEALAAWLTGEGVTQVVMEATGQYWKPIWYGGRRPSGRTSPGRARSGSRPAAGRRRR